jgi:translocation protein SEC63
MDEVIGTLGQAYLWEWPKPKRKASLEVDKTEAIIEQTLGNKWREIRRQAGLVDPGPLDNRRRALVLLYAHLLRLPLSEATLRNGASVSSVPSPYCSLLLPEQIELLLQSPYLLNSLLAMSISRNWLVPTLSVMRLHAYLAQALTPGNDRLKLAQLPNVKADEVVDLSGNATILENFVQTLDAKGDSRIEDMKRAMQTWGRLELVEASFKGSFSCFLHCSVMQSLLSN